MTGELTGLGEGFEAYYSASTENWIHAYRSGLIVLDTNALLDLYRLSPSARNELFAVLEALKDRIFIPHQVASEFHKRRVDAVVGRLSEIETNRTSLDDARRQALNAVRSVARRTHGREDEANATVKTLESAFETAATFVHRTADEYDLDPDSIATVEDVVLIRLKQIVEGRVGGRPSHEALEEDGREAARRAREDIPPGFKDAGKKDNSYGDYLWWAEVKRFCTGTHQDVY